MLAVVCAVITFAQDDNELKKRIGEIKKSGLYAYADATANSKQEAFDCAEEKLYANINAFIAKTKDANGQAKANEVYNVEKIEIPRANLFRAFLYVKFTDIIPNKEEEEKRDEETPAIGAMDTTPAPTPVERILAFETFDELKVQLADMKEQGLVTSYGKYQELTTPEEFMLIIFDAQGKVRAVLSEGKERTNMKTKAPDSISNYKGTGCVGVKVAPGLPQ